MNIPAYVIGVVVYAVGSAVVATWMVAVAVVAGAVMRQAHYEVAGKRWFVLVRRYGLLGAACWCLRKVATRRVKIGDIRGARTVLPFLQVAFVCFVSPLLLPVLVRAFLLPVNRPPSSLLDALSDATVGAGLLGVAMGMWIWLGGLSYLANPYFKRGRVPGIQVSRELDGRGRDRLAVDFFWYRHIASAGVFAAAYPFLFVQVALSIKYPSLLSEPSSTPPTVGSPGVILLLLLSFIVIVSPCMVPAFAAANWFERRFAHSHVAAKLSGLVATRDPALSERVQDIPDFIPRAMRHVWARRRRKRARGVPKTIPESMEARRGELVNVAELLHQAARRIDAQQSRGFTPHPTATLFRGVVQTIRQHLRSPIAYDAQLPGRLSETLRLTLFVLVDACGVDGYQVLAVRVSAFDDAGNPSADPLAKPPGRLARLYERVTATVLRMGAVVTALAAVAVVIIAISLAVLGKINIESLLRLLK